MPSHRPPMTNLQSEDRQVDPPVQVERVSNEQAHRNINGDICKLITDIFVHSHIPTLKGCFGVEKANATCRSGVEEASAVGRGITRAEPTETTARTCQQHTPIAACEHASTAAHEYEYVLRTAACHGAGIGAVRGTHRSSSQSRQRNNCGKDIASSSHTNNDSQMIRK